MAKLLIMPLDWPKRLHEGVAVVLIATPLKIGPRDAGLEPAGPSVTNDGRG